MKSFIFLLLFTSFSTGAHATTTTFEDAPKLVQFQLAFYLSTVDYLDFDVSNPTDALDEDKIQILNLECEDGNFYDFLKVYSGDTAHGPLFIEGTLDLKGAHSDGDFYLYGENGEKLWMTCRLLSKTTRFASL